MRYRNRKQEPVAEINITPFTDVILVLLVIFMITTPLISESRLKVRLPSAKSGHPNEGFKQERLDITITREGPIYLNGQIVTKKELKEQARNIHISNPDLIVVVHADKFVKFQDIVSVLDPLSELGITKIDISTIAEG
jgi:biopolymer transport protein ExbD